MNFAASLPVPDFIARLCAIIRPIILVPLLAMLLLTISALGGIIANAVMTEDAALPCVWLIRIGLSGMFRTVPRACKSVRDSKVDEHARGARGEAILGCVLSTVQIGGVF